MRETVIKRRTFLHWMGLVVLSSGCSGGGSGSSPTPTPTPRPTPTPTPSIKSVHVIVSGDSDIWLAGMPNGSTARYSDVAPAQSPTQVSGLDLTKGGYLTFSATGVVDNNSRGRDVQNRADGGFLDGNFAFASHADGPENGIGDIYVPINSLIGVFLTDARPDKSTAPEIVDYTKKLDYLEISPQLKQPFFIGDGLTGTLTGTGEVQRVKIPAGATRLFLGPMDRNDYANNGGEFSVHVTQYL